MRNQRPWFYHPGSRHQGPFSHFLVNHRFHHLHLQTVLSSPHRKAVLPSQKQKLQTDPSQKGRFSSAVTRCWLREVTNETNLWKLECGFSFSFTEFSSSQLKLHFMLCQIKLRGWPLNFTLCLWISLIDILALLVVKWTYLVRRKKICYSVIKSTW